MHLCYLHLILQSGTITEDNFFCFTLDLFAVAKPAVEETAGITSAVRITELQLALLKGRSYNELMRIADQRGCCLTL